MIDDLAHMKSETNSLEHIEQIYKEGVIDAYVETLLAVKGDKSSYADLLQWCRSTFDSKHGRRCENSSLGSNSRWGIVSKKNLFGLKALLFPNDKELMGNFSKTDRLYLKAEARKISISKV